jgi:hypothetical protein
MSKTYKLTVEDLEFDVYIKTENKAVLLCVDNKQYDTTTCSYLYGIRASPQDLELFNNLNYALENGTAALSFNECHSGLIITANFGIISGKPVIFKRHLAGDYCEIKEILLQKKYNILLEKYNALEKTHNALLASCTCQQ